MSTRYLEFYQTTAGKEILRREAEYLEKSLLDCGRILDVGCGPGVFEKTLPNFCIVGVDSDPGMIQAAGKQCSNEFVLGDAENLPFRDNSFDCLFYVTSMEFTGDYRKAIDEAARVLSRKGRIVVLMLNPESRDYRRRMKRRGYVERNIRHRDMEEIKKYMMKRFIVREEYLLGIKGDVIYDTRDPEYASIYSLRGRIINEG